MSAHAFREPSRRIKEGLEEKYELHTNGTKRQLAERLANKFTNEDGSGSESDNESDSV